MNELLKLQNEMRSLRAEVDRLRNGLYQRPIAVPPGGSSPIFYVLSAIEGGSTLWSSGAQSISGIKYDGATSITTVPNVDASVPAIGTFATGLGRATLLGSSGKVYVALRPNPGTGVITGVISDIPNDMVVLSISKTSIPLVSDATVLVDVYIVYRF